VTLTLFSTEIVGRLYKPTVSILEGFLLIKKKNSKRLKVKQEGKRETGLLRKKNGCKINS